MKILALDSSTEACSVALLTDQKVVEKFDVIGRGHAEHLLPVMQELLDENNTSFDDIDLFSYGAGPGSFTGLRIGAAIMQGLALAKGRKLIAVSSLTALAAKQQGVVLSVIDARMDQVYHGLYFVDDDARPELTGELGVSPPHLINLPHKAEITITGTGWDRYKDDFSQMKTSDREIIGVDAQFPHAADIARLALYESQQGRETDPAEALPHYVRDNVAKKMAER